MLRNRRIIPNNNIWSPLEIETPLIWIDFGDASTLYTDDGTSLVANDGDPIYMARDKSGNNRHVKNVINFFENTVPVDPSYRPLYKTGIKNGLSVARFAETNCRLMISNLATKAIDLLLGSTLFIIGNTTSATFPRGLMGGSGKANVQWRYNNSTTLGFAQTGAPGMSFQLSCTSANYNLFTYTVQPSPQLIEGWVNGATTPGVTDTSWTATTCWVTMIGDSADYSGCLGGDICEWIIYGRCLSNLEIQSVRNYLNRKWALY